MYLVVDTCIVLGIVQFIVRWMKDGLAEIVAVCRIGEKVPIGTISIRDHQVANVAVFLVFRGKENDLRPVGAKGDVGLGVAKRNWKA